MRSCAILSYTTPHALSVDCQCSRMMFMPAAANDQKCVFLKTHNGGLQFLFLILLIQQFPFCSQNAEQLL